MDTFHHDFLTLTHERRITRNLLSPTKSEYVFGDGSRVIFEAKLVKQQEQPGKIVETIDVLDTITAFRYEVDGDICVYHDLTGALNAHQVHWLKAKQALINFAVEKLNSSL